MLKCINGAQVTSCFSGKETAHYGDVASRVSAGSVSHCMRKKGQSKHGHCRRSFRGLASSKPPAKRSEGVLGGYKKAFTGFTDDEMAILDGVILEPADGH